MTNIRLLTPEASAQIRYFYKRSMWIGLLTLFIVIIGGYGFGVACYIYLHEGIIGMTLFVAATIFIDRWLFTRKIKRAEEVYQSGDQITIRLISVDYNYGYRKNGMPQQIINIDKGTEQIKVKTFSNIVVDAFSPSSQAAFVSDKYPGVLIPSSIFSTNFYDPSAASKPKAKVKSINM